MIEGKQFWVVLTDYGQRLPNIGDTVDTFPTRSEALEHAQELSIENGGRYFLAHVKEMVERVPDTVVRSLKK